MLPVQCPASIMYDYYAVGRNDQELFPRILPLYTKKLQVSTKERRGNLIEGVRHIIEQCSTYKNLLNGMKTTDAIERLGIGYHFEKEIHKFMDILNNMGHEDILNNMTDKDAYFTAVALRFRLLRQHRFDVPCGKSLGMLLPSLHCFSAACN